MSTICYNSLDRQSILMYGNDKMYILNMVRKEIHLLNLSLDEIKQEDVIQRYELE
jgi:hypothetical protein